MKLKGCTVPVAGKFQVGKWDGREYAWSQSRRLPGIVCLALAISILGWCVAGWVWPKSAYVPEVDQIPLLLWIVAGFAFIGAVLLTLRKRWRIVPARGEISSRWWPGFGAGVTMKAPKSLWVQVHPVRVQLRGMLGWEGKAVVVHVDDEHGAIIAAGDETVAVMALTTAGKMGLEFRIAPGDAIDAVT